MRRAQGLHKFMHWPHPLLTDSRDFQMVSLLDLAEITEEGVKFQSPDDPSSTCMLTPEHSITIQSSIGADIIMKFDDVVSSTLDSDDPRVEEAVSRTIRWLDRFIAAHGRTDKQNRFLIVQGGLNKDLRKYCAEKLIKRGFPGFAIGGLSGGESKGDFWKMVLISTQVLPKDKPRYLMGVGFPEDLVVCVALGVDMFDGVYPTRTARFGCALTWSGQLNLKQKRFKEEFGVIDEECDCGTCKGEGKVTRVYLNGIVTNETMACHLLTVHNMRLQMRLMGRIREALKGGGFVDFVRGFMKRMYPEWSKEALREVGIELIRKRG